MRLYTKSDLERTARRAVWLLDQKMPVEQAVMAAVAEVSGDATEWLHVVDVQELLKVAYERGQRDYREQRNCSPEEAVDDLLP